MSEYNYKWNSEDNKIFKEDWAKHGNPDNIHWGKEYKGNWASVLCLAQRAARWVAQKKDESYQNEIQKINEMDDDSLASENLALVHENENFRQLLKEASLIISKQTMYGTWLNSIGEKTLDFNAKMHKNFRDWFKDEPKHCDPC